MLYEHAQGLTQDIIQAKRYSALACEYGFKAGCENLKFLEQYSDTENLNEYSKVYQKHCEMGLGIACGNLVFYYYQDISGVNTKSHKGANAVAKGL